MRWYVVALFLVGCVVDRTVATNTLIVCEQNEDCPPDWMCDTIDRMCSFGLLDDTEAAISLTPAIGLITSESGGRASFTARLVRAPKQPVTIALASLTPGECSVSPNSLVFAAGNTESLSVDVTGVDDDRVDGAQPCRIELAAAVSDDARYAGLLGGEVAGTNNDNDVAGLTMNAPTTLVTREGGASMSWTMRLSSRPTSSVLVGIASGLESEGTVDQPALTFTTETWAEPQVVTITGVDDDYADDDQSYEVVFSPALSEDENYAGVTPPSLAAINLDDDNANINVVPASGLVTTESGLPAAFVIVMTSRPTADVVIPLLTLDSEEIELTAASVTFTSENWQIPQPVVIHGLDDPLPHKDGDKPFSISVGPTVSADPIYDAIVLPSALGTNLDNDTTGLLVTPINGLTTTENGGTDTLSISLRSVPMAPVTVHVTPSMAFEAAVGPTSLLFDESNWDVLQEVTITGLDDTPPRDDGVQSFAIVLDTVSTDADYSGLMSSVSITNADNDTSTVLLTAPTGPTRERGATRTLALSLSTAPYGDVTIEVSTDDQSEGVVAPTSITITESDWSDPHVVTITPVDDADLDADVTYHVTFAPAVSSDTLYAGAVAPTATVINIDDELRLWESASTQTGQTIRALLTSDPTQSDTVCARTGTRYPAKAFIASGDIGPANTARTVNPIVNWILMPNANYHRFETSALVATTDSNRRFNIPLNEALVTSTSACFYTGIYTHPTLAYEVNWVSMETCGNWAP